MRVDGGAVAAGCSADRHDVMAMLNESLAAGLLRVLRHRHRHFMVRGIPWQSVAHEILDPPQDERACADLIARRILQLGGAPGFTANGITGWSHAGSVDGGSTGRKVPERTSD
jgi:bacterioferritin